VTADFSPKPGQRATKRRKRKTTGEAAVYQWAEVASASETKWDEHGMAWHRSFEGGPIPADMPWEPRPDLAFGSPMGDLIIDPWFQDAMADARKQDK
jgi:hypothetical protein